MRKKTLVCDKNGRPVVVGSQVRVLALPAGVMDSLEPEEVERVKSMDGDVLEVEEIDEHSFAWVTRWWGKGTEAPEAHSLALSTNEMEVV